MGRARRARSRTRWTTICMRSTPRRTGIRRSRVPIWRIGRPPTPAICGGSTRPATTRSTTRSTPAFEKAYALGHEPAGQVLRRHRVPAAHRGRAAAPDRARHRGRARRPAGRTAPPPDELDAEIAAVEAGDRRRAGRDRRCVTATNSSPRPPGTCCRTSARSKTTSGGLDRAARENDRGVGGLQGRTARRAGR